MGIVNQTIEDGVADRGVREAGMPLGNGHLSGYQRRGAAVPVVQDLSRS